jgi:hypothetical protein
MLVVVVVVVVVVTMVVVMVWANTRLVRTAQEYTMVILSCTATTKDTNINVAFDLEMLNPGGMHISLEKAPLVPMFYTLLAIYLVMCGACAMMDSTLRLGETHLAPLLLNPREPTPSPASPL